MSVLPLLAHKAKQRRADLLCVVLGLAQSGKEGQLATNPECKPDTIDDPIWRPKQVEQETNASWKTIKRGREDKVIHLGLRAVGMRKSDVLRPVSRNR